VVITGDFISRSRYAGLLPEVLKDLDAPLGVYACLGNHDYWSDVELVRSELAKTKVQLLDARGRVVENNGAKLQLSACEDPWGDERWISPERQGGTPMVVLSHTADNIYELSEAGASVVFTGHYHAGQGALPWYGPVVIPSKYGRRFDHGHFLVDETDLFVTAGVGIAFPPFRVYCHPEVLVVDLAAVK
jgi:predicted MPP superfamily phosphohydrolase